jgi:hypothetical protein
MEGGQPGDEGAKHQADEGCEGFEPVFRKTEIQAQGLLPQHERLKGEISAGEATDHGLGEDGQKYCLEV